MKTIKQTVTYSVRDSVWDYVMFSVYDSVEKKVACHSIFDSVRRNLVRFILSNIGESDSVQIPIENTVRHFVYKFVWNYLIQSFR